MESSRDPNPYLLLRVGTTASKQEVIQRSRELSQETLDRDEQAELRRAVEEICQHPVRHARCQFWEPPNTCYNDEALDRFCEAYRNPPFTRQMLEDRRRRFIEEDCSAKRLAVLARCCCLGGRAGPGESVGHACAGCCSNGHVAQEPIFMAFAASLANRARQASAAGTPFARACAGSGRWGLTT
jgi:hypothetical protein